MTARLCSVDGCDRPALARGWCKTHYMRWRRHGDPTVTVRSPAAHGTASMYEYWKCQCALCRAGNTARNLRLRELRAAALAAGVRAPTRHGVLSTYNNWGCRCAPCTAANTARSAALYAKKAAR